MKTVAHCATPYLPETAPWLHHQIAGLRHYRAIVLTQERINSDLFPMPETVHTPEAMSPAGRLANRMVRGLLREFPFYAGILRREGASLIHAHFGHHACRCLRARRIVDLPMVTSFYGEDASRFARIPRWQRRYRRLFEEGSLFLAEGSAMAAQLERIGCPTARIRIHHLGVRVGDIPFSTRVATDQVRVLICASFREKKGIPTGMEALGRALRGLSGIDCRVVLIGDGPQRQQIAAAADSAGLAKRVDWLGVLPYAQVLRQMARCHLLLQPSLTAADGDTEGGAPVTLLDAQASGLPVVATDHADIAEYVVDGHSGLLSPEGDVEALAASLRTMLSEQARWGDMGRRGRQHVEDNYDTVRQCAALEDIYSTLS